MTVMLCGAALLLSAAVAVVVASRNRQQPAPPPDVPVAALPAEVRVKAVERKLESLDHEVVDASSAVAVVCGADATTADRYEARNDALRSVARRRDLPEKDVAALVAYLRSKDNAMRVERVAALKNDVMNLLRNQDPPPKDLAGTLIGIFEGGKHPPVVLDYCIQHLGAMLDELDEKGRLRVRAVLAKAAKRTKQPYAGTALYSLAEDARATPAQDKELKGLALALCKPGVNNIARIAAIQLAGERGYAEALPVLRETLLGARRDAVLDTVCIGSVGLLGNADDIPILSRFSSDSRRAAAVDAAIQRIKERADAN
ncbi:MAG: hypothetical protein IKQ17_09400 [Kiritimatiellae bacterium]|nr:hypothetical protein [Kiritimatiellia bacterium]